MKRLSFEQLEDRQVLSVGAVVACGASTVVQLPSARDNSASVAVAPIYGDVLVNAEGELIYTAPDTRGPDAKNDQFGVEYTNLRGEHIDEVVYVGVIEGVSATSNTPQTIPIDEEFFGGPLGPHRGGQGGANSFHADYRAQITRWPKGDLVLRSNQQDYEFTAHTTGVDSFDFHVVDENGCWDDGTISFEVYDTKTDVVAHPDEASTMYGRPVVIPVMANDQGSDLRITSIETDSTSRQDQIDVRSDGTVYFLPANAGTHRFIYEVGNGRGITDRATVIVTVSERVDQFGTAAVWTKGFSLAGETPLVGDFDADGRADIVTFTRGSYMDAWVALNNKANGSFGSPKKWHDNFVADGEKAAVGDFNGDGRDDVLTFTRSPANDVYVGLSDGSRFVASKWNDDFGPDGEFVTVGDFNGDGKDDLITFRRNNVNGVRVALSDGTKFNASTQWLTGFSPKGHKPRVGDFNHDGKDDIVSFASGTDGSREVFVALSTGSGFNKASRWASRLGGADQTPDVGDFNGDGYDDIVVFTQRSEADVIVALSDGATFGTPTVWHQFFAPSGEQPAVGNFDSDDKHKDDIITFVQDAAGTVWVALAPLYAEPVQLAQNLPRPAYDDTYETRRGQPIEIAPSANDQRYESGPNAIVSIDSPLHGTLHSTGAGAFLYSPDSSFIGVETISYATVDARRGLSSAVIRINVTEFNRDPIAGNIVLEVTARSSISIDVISATQDTDGDVLRIQSASQPEYGHVEIVNGEVRYTPATTFSGVELFTYEVRDEFGGVAVGTIMVIVVPMLRGDLNGDGWVDAADAGLMFSEWGRAGKADLNGDGIVDAADAGILFSEWS